MIEQLARTSGSTWWSAARVDRDEAAYRPGHRLGNRLLTGFVAHVFGQTSPTCCPATACSRAAS